MREGISRCTRMNESSIAGNDSIVETVPTLDDDPLDSTVQIRCNRYSIYNNYCFLLNNRFVNDIKNTSDILLLVMLDVNHE